MSRTRNRGHGKIEKNPFAMAFKFDLISRWRMWRVCKWKGLIKPNSVWIVGRQQICRYQRFCGWVVAIDWSGEQNKALTQNQCLCERFSDVYCALFLKYGQQAVAFLIRMLASCLGQRGTISTSDKFACHCCGRKSLGENIPRLTMRQKLASDLQLLTRW